MALRTVCTRAMLTVSRSAPAVQRQASAFITRSNMRQTTPMIAVRVQRRCYAEKSQADLVIEDITELYATAQDEFEIAMEETEKSSVYAEEDRKACRAELETLQAAFRKIVDGEDKELAEQVNRRIGQRIRELEGGVARMEEMALEHD